MNTMFFNRRSIRKYKDTPIRRADLEAILLAGTLAPSSKNRQPWRFVVVSGAAKDEMLTVLQNGLKREKHEPMLVESNHYIGGAEQTFAVMEQAPVIIFIVNPLGASLHQPLTAEQRVYELCNAQSFGAAIENMSLAATDLGLGSLWICDTYFAHRELSEWLGGDGEPAAALAVGYADEAPAPRPRKTLSEVVEWRD